MTKREWIDELSESLNLLILPDYDDCILGLGRKFNEHFVVYDYKKVINKLIAEGMTEEEAVEFHEFNQVGAYVGEGTPAFLVVPDEE